MSNKISLTETAQIEYEATVLWYEESTRGMGLNFVMEVEKIYRSIQSSPLSFPIVIKNYRAARVFHFPYRIIF